LSSCALFFFSNREPQSRDEILHYVQENFDSAEEVAERVDKMVDAALFSLVKTEEIHCQTFPDFENKIYWSTGVCKIEKIVEKSPSKSSARLNLSDTPKVLPSTPGRKPFKSPLRVNSESAPTTPLSSNGKRKRISTGKSLHVPSLDISQMSLDQLTQELKKCETILKEREKQLVEAKKQNEENEKKKGVTQAGNEDGRVSALADKWVRVCQIAGGHRSSQT